MFEPNTRVVCINDHFPAIIHRVYTALPVRDQTYTVRECELGREQINTKGGTGWDSACWKVLLHELLNPLDTTMKPGTAVELGFSASRFRELETLPPAKDKVKNINRELVPV